MTQQVFLRILNTGIQYFPVDSMQTSEQEYLASQSAKSCNPLVSKERRACLCSVQAAAVFAENFDSHLPPSRHSIWRKAGRDWSPDKIESIRKR